MLDERAVIKILEYRHAILKGHFVLSSKKHSSHYFDKYQLFADEYATTRICRTLAHAFVCDPIDIVVGPPKGGAIIAGHVAKYLREKKFPEGRDVQSVIVEETAEKNFSLSNASRQAIAAKNVLVVDDTATTGKDLKAVIELVRKAGAQTIAAGVILNRGDIKAEYLGVRRFAFLVYKNFELWDKPTCPLCMGNIPETTVPRRE